MTDLSEQQFIFDGQLTKPKNLRGYQSFWTDGLSLDVKTGFLSEFFNKEDHYSASITAVSEDEHTELSISPDQSSVSFTAVAKKKKMQAFFSDKKNHFGAAIYSSAEKEIRILCDHDRYCAFLIQPEQKYKVVVTKIKGS